MKTEELIDKLKHFPGYDVVVSLGIGEEYVMLRKTMLATDDLNDRVVFLMAAQEDVL